MFGGSPCLGEKLVLNMLIVVPKAKTLLVSNMLIVVSETKTLLVSNNLLDLV